MTATATITGHVDKGSHLEKIAKDMCNYIRHRLNSPYPDPRNVKITITVEEIKDAEEVV